MEKSIEKGINNKGVNDEAITEMLWLLFFIVLILTILI